MSDKSYRDIVHDELVAFSEYVCEHADEWADVIAGGCTGYSVEFTGDFFDGSGNEKPHEIKLTVKKASKKAFEARL